MAEANPNWTLSEEDMRNILAHLPNPFAFGGPEGPSLSPLQLNAASSQHEKGPPMLSGSLNTSALNGQVGVSGRYQAIPESRPDWAAMLRYRREY